MRIGIDARYLSHGLVGGVHTYITRLVTALVRADSPHAFFLYADTKRPFELTELPAHVTVRYLPYRARTSSVYHDWFMHRQIARDELDVLHFPANYGFGPRNARTVITLHDQINILPWREIFRGHRKNLRTVSMMAYLRLCSTRALRHAHMLVTVSNFSKEQIIANSDFDPDRIAAFLYPPSPIFNRITDSAVLAEVRQRLGLTRPFVLADGVKNPAALVSAWELLPEELRARYQITFFSRTPTPPEVVRQAEASGYARVLVRPSNQDLVALYSMAEAFAFPSWVEGLGLPLMEAMRCGAPVVASDRGSIPEVTGDAALLTDVDDIQGMARNLMTVLGNPIEAERMRQRGFARMSEFTWDKTAQRMFDVYERVRSLPLR